jgi:predicted deacylase
MTSLGDLAPGHSEWTTLNADVGLEHLLDIDIFLARGEQTTPLALLTAGVHGDEYEGPDALARVSRLLAKEDLAGSVIVVPVVNPLAFAAAQRLTPIDGKNLARCFPGCRDGSPTERLAYAIFESLVRPSTHLIDLHSGGVEYVFTPVAGFYGSSSPHEPSYEAARRFGLDCLWQLPETKGVLSCEAWKLGKTSIGCEYLGAGQLSPKGSEAYVRGILSCLAYWGILRGYEPSPEAGEPYRNDWQLAESDGLFHAQVELGTAVREGDIVAVATDLRGNPVQTFVAKTDGVVLGLRFKAWLRKDDWGVLIGTPCRGEDH